MICLIISQVPSPGNCSSFHCSNSWAFLRILWCWDHAEFPGWLVSISKIVSSMPFHNSIANFLVLNSILSSEGTNLSSYIPLSCCFQVWSNYEWNWHKHPCAYFFGEHKLLNTFRGRFMMTIHIVRVSLVILFWHLNKIQVKLSTTKYLIFCFFFWPVQCGSLFSISILCCQGWPDTSVLLLGFF